jgi:glycosyltransferase involved in cell wall biosynthesis
MAAELRQSGADVIHAEWTYEFADAALRAGRPCLVTGNDAPWLIAWHFRRAYRVLRALYSSLWVVPRIRHLTCVSPHIRRAYLREPLFRGACRVIPNGLAERHFAAAPRTSLRAPDAPVFGAATEWNPLKNVPCLLRAFGLVRRELPGARLLVCGPGLGAGEAAGRWAARWGLDVGVTFAGLKTHAEMLDTWAHAVDVAVHTTREESFSMVVLEAMAKGMPVVGGRHSGGVPWLLDGGRAGLLADVGRPEDVAAQMIRLARDPALYRETAARGWTRARSQFGLRSVAAQYLEAYAQVADAGRRDGRLERSRP